MTKNNSKYSNTPKYVWILMSLNKRFDLKQILGNTDVLQIQDMFRQARRIGDQTQLPRQPQRHERSGGSGVPE